MKTLLVRFWPYLVIVALWFAFGSPYFIKGLIPFPSRYLVTFFPPWSAFYGMPVKNNAMPDVVGQIYPWKRLTIDSWKIGQVPLWNPYVFAGTPHAANYQTAVFSPLNLLFFILPEIDAWSLLVLLQPLLAGLFMYGFLRGLDKSQISSALGSIAYMFCGFIVVWMAYGTLAFAVVFLPLILWGITQFLKHPSLRSGLAISFGTASSFFSGHFQMSLYVAIFAFAYIVANFLQKKNLKRIVAVSIFFVCGLGLSFPQILPSLYAFQNSVRSGLYANGGEITWKYLVTMLAPDFYGNPVTRNDWYGTYAEWASYIGVVPLVLAFYAIVSKREFRKNFFIASAILTFLLATPTFLTKLLINSHIPALSTSIPSRIIVLCSFSLAVLSSFGFDHLIFDWKNHSWRRLSVVLTIFLLIFGSLWMIVLFGKPFDVDKVLIARRNMVFPTLLFFTAGVIYCCGFIFKFKKYVLFSIFSLLLLLISALDMLRYASKWMPFEERQYMYPQIPVITFLKNTVFSERIFGFFGGELANSFHLPSLEGYDAIYQQRYGEFVQSWGDGKIKVPERSVVNINKNGLYTPSMLQFLGVQYYLHRISDGRNVWAYPVWKYPHFEKIYSDDSYEVYRDDNAYPRTFLASSYVVETDKQKIVDILLDEHFDRRNTIILEQKPVFDPEEGSGTARLMMYTQNIVDIETDSQTPKLLFLSDVYDDGWKAYIDGKDVSIYRADYDFRSVAVPSGKHAVRFLYSPISFRMGGIIAVVSGVVLLLASQRIIYYANRNI